MSASWSWDFEDAEGHAAQPAVAPPPEGFGAQSDAESWIGEQWRPLLSGGAEQAWLRRDGERVGRPLSLRPTG